MLAVTLTPLGAVNLPRQSPELTFDLLGGGKVHLSSYRGKVVLLEFLFTTCPHCAHASQMFSRLYTEFGPKGFQPLGIAVNSMAQMFVADFIKENNVNYPVGFGPSELALNYLGISMVERWVVPQVVLIDRKGVIRAQSGPLGDERLQTESYLREQIEALLKEPAASTRKSGTTAKRTALIAHKAGR